ncbi:MAG: hypothetical protein AMXMBFR84_39050 [Candidatus Hydrogenedentota bacterium]
MTRLAHIMKNPEWKPFLILLGAFLACFYLPVGTPRFDSAVTESLQLVKWYAREHVLLCLIPAFFIAGAIGVFISQASVMKYLGAGANKFMAYGVASVSGSVLAVCSCTVLPLFAGIYRMGAGLGPATAFLYSGPAVNVLAIILTARVLGWELGAARAVGAVTFSVVIGLAMHLIFRKEEQVKAQAAAHMPIPEVARPLWQNVLYFASMIAILVFSNWGKPAGTEGLWNLLYETRWAVTAVCGVLLATVLVLWFNVAWWKPALVAAAVAVGAALFPHWPLIAFTAGLVGLVLITATGTGEMSDWFSATWDYAKLIMPLLLVGVLLAGFLLGRPGEEGLIPSEWIERWLGGNSLSANLVASVAGAFMYFATLTEVPIVQGLMGSGMGPGPALALLLAGPALSLPSMLVIRSILGTKKTVVYVSLVIIMSTITGMAYGAWNQ